MPSAPIQQVLAEPARAKKFSGGDRHGLIALLWSHPAPCGAFSWRGTSGSTSRPFSRCPVPRTPADASGQALAELGCVPCRRAGTRAVWLCGRSVPVCAADGSGL